MPIRFPEMLRVSSGPLAIEWTDQDVILHALALGMGAKPVDERTLRFVYERDLVTIPTFAAVMARSAYPSFEEMGVDYAYALHAEQRTEFHVPVPPQANAIGQGRVVGVRDRGAGKGVVIVSRIELTDAASGQPIATATASFLARTDGGFGGPRDPYSERHPIPTRRPDATIDYRTQPDQALLFRLLGDGNPLHADPEVARTAGFRQPILHGLCTYGITCRAVLEAFADWDPSRIASHQVRFSAPVFPGDVVTVDLWKDGRVVSFVARVKERDSKVIDNGRSLLTHP